MRCLLYLFFNDPAPPELYTLSLHDALPISSRRAAAKRRSSRRSLARSRGSTRRKRPPRRRPRSTCTDAGVFSWLRSEEHTSELQSLTNLVCRLLLEKKKHRHEEGLQYRMRL